MKMRCFIGLDLPVNTKLALESWRKKALPEVKERAQTKRPAKSNTPAEPVAVPTANFHITLAFLGQVDARQHEALLNEMEQVKGSPFSLTLDSTALWEGPKILLAAPGEPDDALMDLARQVRKAARAAGVQVDGRPYRPHVTMVRKATDALPPPLFAPDIHADFSQFHLFESFSNAQGVRYPIRHSWSLIPNMSVRERLRQGLTDN